MMKKIYLMMIVLLAMLPATVMAMSHGNHDEHKGHDMHKEKAMDHSKMDHGDMKHDKMDHSSMKHDGMGMKGQMASLGEETIKGVKAKARIKDVSAAMNKMGMAETHHIMVGFSNEKSGAALSKGTVAIKIEGPDGKESKPKALMGMHGEFGADISLKQKGMYHFYIGTKLEDGEKRKYHFHVDVK